MKWRAKKQPGKFFTRTIEAPRGSCVLHVAPYGDSTVDFHWWITRGKRVVDEDSTSGGERAAKAIARSRSKVLCK
jgi:hypothetical protein